MKNQTKQKTTDKKQNSSELKSGKKNLIIGLVVIVFLIALYLLIKPSNTNMITTNGTDRNIAHSAFSFTKNGELTFIKKDGEFITKIEIEIADNDAKRAQGLMYRDKMKFNRGMLFIFPKEDYQSFWMKNTTLPLDMIFVNKDGEIVKIHKNTTPYTLESYPSGKPAQFVVEVNAGFTDKFNIVEGDKITWRKN